MFQTAKVHNFFFLQGLRRTNHTAVARNAAATAKHRDAAGRRGVLRRRRRMSSPRGGASLGIAILLPRQDESRTRWGNKTSAAGGRAFLAYNDRYVAASNAISQAYGCGGKARSEN